MAKLGNVLILTGIFLTPFTYADGDLSKGQTLYNVCIACHGDKGQGNAPLRAPRLAGQEPWYIKAMIRKFKAGLRGTDPKDTYGAQMRAMSFGLVNDQAIDDVVAFIGTLQTTTPPDLIEGDATKGKSYYIMCTACHGMNGQGNSGLKAPKLQDQHGWYLYDQIQAFKKGWRGSDPSDASGVQMKAMAFTLPNDQAIKDVVAHIQTLK
jgi:cytochrome c553